MEYCSCITRGSEGGTRQDCSETDTRWFGCDRPIASRSLYVVQLKFKFCDSFLLSWCSSLADKSRYPIQPKTHERTVVALTARSRSSQVLTADAPLRVRGCRSWAGCVFRAARLRRPLEFGLFFPRDCHLLFLLSSVAPPHSAAAPFPPYSVPSSRRSLYGIAFVFPSIAVSVRAASFAAVCKPLLVQTRSCC